MPTRSEARDIALGAASLALSGLGIPVIWDGTFGDPPTDRTVTWARAGLSHAVEEQAAIGRTSENKRLYRSSAVLTIQIMTPMDGGVDLADSTSVSVRDSIRGLVASDIEFGNVTASEAGIDGSWWRTDVTSDVEYYGLT